MDRGSQTCTASCESLGVRQTRTRDLSQGAPLQRPEMSRPRGPASGQCAWTQHRPEEPWHAQQRPHGLGSSPCSWDVWGSAPLPGPGPPQPQSSSSGPRLCESLNTARGGRVASARLAALPAISRPCSLQGRLQLPKPVAVIAVPGWPSVPQCGMRAG